MDIENLAPELQKKVKGCKTVEELRELVNAEGYELSDKDLEDIAGGEREWHEMCGDRVCEIGDRKTTRAS